MVTKKTVKLPKEGENAKPATGINLVRKDYLVDERVVIASARAKRPDQFEKKPEKKTKADTCPFCPHNQDKILIEDEVPNPKSKYGWIFRSAVNLFAAVTPNQEPPKPSVKRRLMEESQAFGYAEVVIETPEHGVELEDMSIKNIASLLHFLGKRVQELRSRPGIRYVSLFKNRGAAAGASISHSHTQIIATHFLPGNVLELLEANFKNQTITGRNPFDEIVAEESGGPRMVMENDHVAMFTPFASKLPFELWIVPKRQVTSLSLMTLVELESIAEAMKQALTTLDQLGNPAYNMLFLGDGEYGELRFHIRIMPRVNIQAGFELGTGTIINPVPPEDAARFYRGER